MKAAEAFRELLPLLKDEPAVHANGYICRESFQLRDREANFYMIGSMGLASSIGLGVALCRPDKKVIVLDGDGNVLMAMGTLAMIAAAAPANLLHIVLDNREYESTGGQRTLSSSVPLEEVARSAGYRTSLRITEREELKPAFLNLMNGDGPAFLLIQVEADFDSSTGRVTHSPQEIKARFMKALARSAPHGGGG